jgi:hypothetical protein
MSDPDEETWRMAEPIVYEEMRSGEEPAVCELVERVFSELVAPDYEREGVQEFFRFANPRAMAERTRSGGFVLVARQAEKLVGMLEFARPDRVAMRPLTPRQPTNAWDSAGAVVLRLSMGLGSSQSSY